MNWKLWIRGSVVCLAACLLAGCGESEQPRQAESDRDIEAEQKLAAKRQEFDWSSWKALPLLDDGRIKPIDTFAREKCLLVTAGRRWTDPVTEVRYDPPELLLGWMAETDKWARQPMVRCEYRALREMLQNGVIRGERLTFEAAADGQLRSSAIAESTVDGETVQVSLTLGEEPLAMLMVEKPAASKDDQQNQSESKPEYRIRALGSGSVPASWSFDSKNRQIVLEWKDADLDKLQAEVQYEYLRSDIPAKGLYVSVDDVIVWDTWKNERRFEYRCAEIEKRFEKLRRQSRQSKAGPADEQETAEERELNKKVRELIVHIEAFIFAAEGGDLAVVPGVDPRTLTKQVNTSDPVPPWIMLRSLIQAEDWRSERRPDVSVAAFMADSPADLADMLLFHGLDRFSRQELGKDPSYDELKAQYTALNRDRILPDAVYPIEHLAQLAVANLHADDVRPALLDVPEAFESLCEAYRQGDAKDFSDASQTFSRKVQELARTIDQLRPELDVPEQGDLDFGKFSAAVWAGFSELEPSERQIAFGAYPEADATATELKYNRAKPFERAWILFLIVGITGSLTYVVARRRALYAGTIVLALGALLYSTWGFYLRVLISGRAPVTNMYETVIWVGFVVGVMGWIFSLTPLFGPTMGWGWKLTGLPLRLKRNERGRISGVDLDRPTDEQRQRPLAGMLVPVQLASTALIGACFCGMMYVLSMSDTSFRITQLVPDIDPSLSLGDISWLNMATWALGLVTCLCASWLTPRAVLCLVLGFALLPFDRDQTATETRWDKLLSRRFFLIPAMFVACFAMMLAHFVGNSASGQEVLNPEIGGIAAVLRNNYWLTIHVLTIVSSYGAGALAWGLGNLALAYYIFGKYETDRQRVGGDGSSVMARLQIAGRSLRPAMIGSTVAAGIRGMGNEERLQASNKIRPPREVSTLATYNYRVMQVATLLLAAGTILGGLWADVSWGRFWDWDPKEVWALISLLAYLVVLHGRFAGWVGTFGTNVGSVFCFQAIIGSWYGVNFLLPKFYEWWNNTNEQLGVGLHSYATGGDAGWQYVATAMALNVALVFAAMGVYVAQLSSRAHDDDDLVSQDDVEVIEEVPAGV